MISPSARPRLYWSSYKITRSNASARICPWRIMSLSRRSPAAEYTTERRSCGKDAIASIKRRQRRYVVTVVEDHRGAADGQHVETTGHHVRLAAEALQTCANIFERHAQGPCRGCGSQRILGHEGHAALPRDGDVRRCRTWHSTDSPMASTSFLVRRQMPRGPRADGVAA